MPRTRISMRKIKDVLRLHFESGLSGRQIARCLRLSRDGVAKTIARARMANLDWPLPDLLDEADLERLLYREADEPTGKRPLPDWADVHAELRSKGVTLQLIWEEFKARHPDTYQYSRFCDHYRDWRRKLDVVMRQNHKAGEKLFVDYAGQTIDLIDPRTGEANPAQIFVAVLGASNYTYAEATLTQQLEDWIGSHVRSFAYIGGVPEIVIPDNLRAGVTRAHRYEPDVNPTYQDLAVHYGFAVIPARIVAPRDKAKVESGVRVVEQWILARLRKQTFFTLGELNQAIAELLENLNDKPFKKLDGSRRSVFEGLERSKLRPLPTMPYTFGYWKKARVSMDYHIEVDRHYYSVPYIYVREQLDIRVSPATIECFYRGRRIASHASSPRRGGHTTVAAHMPPAHRHYLQCTPEHLAEQASRTGPATAELVKLVIESRAHPQQGYRSCWGILRLGETYGAERLEQAAARALVLGARSYKSVASILKNRLEGRDQAPQPVDAPIDHQNIRGSDYYTNVNDNNSR